jgi:hypothetical protein
MSKKDIIIASSIGVAGLIGIYLVFFRKRKTTQINKPSNELSSVAPQSIKPIIESNPIFEQRFITLPQRQYNIKDRNKFLDEWIAEEGGADSIREMYNKRPSAFPPSDVAYLKSKGVLAGEQIKGRGLTIQNIV